jgi:hypothetical protein
MGLGAAEIVVFASYVRVFLTSPDCFPFEEPIWALKANRKQQLLTRL